MAYTYDSGVERAVYSTKKTGRTLPNGATEMTEDFDSGFSGHGFKIWKTDDGFYKIEADELMIRKSLTAFELIISQIRAIRGSYAITQGNAKIKHVDTYTEGGKGYYRIEIEDEVNTIFEHDFIRCQKGNKEYHVEVSSVHQGYINVLMSEFTSGSDGVVVNPPEAGDEIVQFGNSSRDAAYANRHSAIYMSVDNGEPKIDLMTNIYTKNWDDTLKVRIGGDLPGTDGERGFFAVNGKLMGVDEAGETVYQINPDGSGFFARGNFSWTTDGAPSFSGSIFLRIDNNNVWRVTENGENIIGDEDGQRIVISPSDASMTFFNAEGNAVAIYDGKTQKNPEDFFSSSIPTITITTLPFSAESSSSINYGTIVISKPFQTTAAINMTCNFNISVSHTYAGEYIWFNLNVKTYSDSSLKNLISTKKIYGETYGSGSNPSYNITRDVILTEIGYNVISFDLRFMVGYQSSVSFSMNSLTPIVTANKYISNYFANGLILGTSGNNKFAVYNGEQGGLPTIRFNAENSLFGLGFSRYGIMTKRNGFWGMMPSIISCGLIQTERSYYRFAHFSSYDNNIPSLSKSSTGMVTLTIPSDWDQDQVNDTSCYILTTPRIRPSYRQFYVSANWDNSTKKIYFYIKVDNSTYYDGDFYFEIKRY